MHCHAMMTDAPDHARRVPTAACTLTVLEEATDRACGRLSRSGNTDPEGRHDRQNALDGADSGLSLACASVLPGQVPYQNRMNCSSVHGRRSSTIDSVTGLQAEEVFRTTRMTGVARVVRDALRLPFHCRGPPELLSVAVARSVTATMSVDRHRWPAVRLLSVRVRPPGHVPDDLGTTRVSQRPYGVCCGR